MFEDIRKRCEAAMPGPWRRESRKVVGYFEPHKCDKTHALTVDEFNAEFIAHARQDIPLLLDEIDRLNLIIAEYQKDLGLD